MNGKVGQARTLRRIRLEREREAAAAGVDVRDRAAFRKWDNERARVFYAGLRSRVSLKQSEVK